MNGPAASPGLLSAALRPPVMLGAVRAVTTRFGAYAADRIDSSTEQARLKDPL